jgi:hypothetical protein
MEKSYQNIHYFFIGVLLVVLVGFHITYTIRFPKFEGMQFAQHFHGAMLMSWFAMLICQPILIRKKKYSLHKSLGKISYIQMPLLMYSIFLVTRMVYFREMSNNRPLDSILGQLSLDIPAIFTFGFFFVMAMLNRKNTPAHMRYMIATAIMMIGPGLGRALIIFGGLPFPLAVSIVFYVADAIALLFLIYDYLKGHSIKPFTIILLVNLLNQACWEFQTADWWQAIAGWFAGTFF